MAKQNKICKECGKELSSKSNFCGACGSDKFENITEPKSLAPKSNLFKAIMIGAGILLLVAIYMLGKSQRHSESIAESKQNLSITEVNTTKEANTTKAVNTTESNITDNNATTMNNQSQNNESTETQYQEEENTQCNPPQKLYHIKRNNS